MKLKSAQSGIDFHFHPLTPDRWDDFETLFGPRGAYGGCWCMWWRSKRSEYEQRGNAGNRAAMYEIVHSKQISGILAYEGSQPVGWCSVAPRDDYGSLNRSPVLKKIDDHPVWSIVCFFIARTARNRGLMGALIRAAIEYVRKNGGEIVEAYPTVPRKKGELAPVSTFMGLPNAFFDAGFVEVARPSASKVILRYSIE
jgi:GNAT superfamily N-acetyltransferase